jgi:hypothetical protein
MGAAATTERKEVREENGLQPMLLNKSDVVGGLTPCIAGQLLTRPRPYPMIPFKESSNWYICNH